MGLQELTNDVKYLKEIFEKEDKKNSGKKKFRYPLGKKVGKAQRKKNYATVLILNENGKAAFKKVRISEQTFWEEGIPRLAAAGYVFQEGRRNNPLIILPGWCVEPISPLKHYNQSLMDGTNSVGYRLLMNVMQLEGVNQKKQIGGMMKWIFGAVIIGVIAYAFMTGGGA